MYADIVMFSRRYATINLQSSLYPVGYCKLIKKKKKNRISVSMPRVTRSITNVEHNGECVVDSDLFRAAVTIFLR